MQRSPPATMQQMPKQGIAEPDIPPSNIELLDASNVSARSKRPRLNESLDSTDKDKNINSLTRQDTGAQCHAMNETIVTTLRQEIEAAIAMHLQATLKAYFENQFTELKSTLQELKESVQFMSNDFDDLKMELGKNKDIINQLKKDNEELKSCVSDLRVRLNLVEQYSRQDNVEIHGVPENQAENLVTTVIQLGRAISCNIQNEDVLSVSRVKKLDSQSNRPRSIIAKLRSTRVRDDVLAAVSKFNRAHVSDKLNSGHLGYGGAKMPVYISEHLSSLNKAIHARVRQTAREKGYKYVWIRDGRVLVRKDDGSRAIHIKSLEAIALM